MLIEAALEPASAEFLVAVGAMVNSAIIPYEKLITTGWAPGVVEHEREHAEAEPREEG
jgi:hypothetical protein